MPILDHGYNVVHLDYKIRSIITGIKCIFMPTLNLLLCEQDMLGLARRIKSWRDN